MDGMLITYEDGRVVMRGVDHGGYGQILARNPRAIVVKWPGGTHWASIGQRVYHSPQTVVYHIVETNDDYPDRVKAEALISWENSRKRANRA